MLNHGGSELMVGIRDRRYPRKVTSQPAGRHRSHDNADARTPGSGTSDTRARFEPNGWWSPSTSSAGSALITSSREADLYVHSAADNRSNWRESCQNRTCRWHVRYVNSDVI